MKDVKISDKSNITCPIRKTNVKIATRKKYFRKAQLFRERYGVCINFSSLYHRNYFDASKMVRICRSTNSILSRNSSMKTISNIYDDINQFRFLLNKAHKKHYDQKMRDHQKLPAHELIERTRQAALKSEIRYKNDKFVINKKFNLKAINFNIIMDINPMQDVRIMDIIFPLDSSSLSLDECVEDLPISYKLFKIKRAILLTYDPEDSFYTLKMEEKIPDYHNQMEFKKNQCSYLIKWLESLGDYKANNLKKGFLTCFNDVFNHQDESQSISTANAILDASSTAGNFGTEATSFGTEATNFGTEAKTQTIYPINERFYISKLSDKTLYHIYSKPTIKKVNTMKIPYGKNPEEIKKFVSNKVNSDMESVAMNKKYCEQVGKEVSLNDINDTSNFDEINCLTALRTPKYIDIFSVWFYDRSRCTVEYMSNDICITSPQDQVYLRNVNGDKIPGKLQIFKEEYIENNTIYCVSYRTYETDCCW